MVPPVVETQGTEGEPDHELSSDDDIAQSDPGSLIGEISDSLDEDGSVCGVIDKQAEASGKVSQQDKTPENDIEQGRTIRTRFSPTPVCTPVKHVMQLEMTKPLLRKLQEQI